MRLLIAARARLAWLVLCGCVASAADSPRVPAAPLFRDPVFDGAADPVLIYNREEKCWWMLYTNRRAKLRTGEQTAHAP